MATHSASIRWGRIIAGAFLLELALTVVFVPFMALGKPETVVPFVPVGCLVLGILVGWWVVRKVQGRHVLHGTLTGILATTLYFALSLAAPGGLASIVTMYGPFLFVLGNGLRIVGCIAGALAYRARLPGA